MKNKTVKINAKDLVAFGKFNSILCVKSATGVPEPLNARFGGNLSGHALWLPDYVPGVPIPAKWAIVIDDQKQRCLVLINTPSTPIKKKKKPVAKKKS